MWEQPKMAAQRAEFFWKWNLTGFMNKIFHVDRSLSCIITHCLKSYTVNLMLGF